MSHPLRGFLFHGIPAVLMNLFAGITDFPTGSLWLPIANVLRLV